MRRAIFASTLALLLTAPAAAQDDDVGAAVEAICCGMECCLIGTCRGRGQVNPDNSCEMCDPSTSQSEWTAIPGCVPPDAGTPPATDAGSTTPPPDDGGGCSVGATGARGPLALLSLVGGLALFRRRRGAFSPARRR